MFLVLGAALCAVVFLCPSPSLQGRDTRESSSDENMTPRQTCQHSPYLHTVVSSGLINTPVTMVLLTQRCHGNNLRL